VVHLSWSVASEVLQAMIVPFILASGYGTSDLYAEPVLRDAVNVGKPSRSELLLQELRAALRSTANAVDVPF
jgi:hypothetical protein